MNLPPFLPLLAASLLPAAAAADDLQALRDTAVPSPAAGLPYADALDLAGRPEPAARLRRGLMQAHFAQLNGQPWPAPQRLGDVMDTAPATTRALDEGWRRAFGQHVRLRWGGPLPAALAGLQPQPIPAAPGAWATPGPGAARFIAVLNLANGSPTPITLAPPQLRLADQDRNGLLLFCNPLAGNAADPVAAGAERAFVCRGEGPAEAVPLFARAARGASAAGDRIELQPAPLDSGGGLEALAAAVGSTALLDRAAWAARLQPAVAAQPAPPSAPVAAPAPAKVARAAPPPLPPSAIRPALSVAGGFAFLLLLARLVRGHLDEEPPARTALRTLPWVALMIALAVGVGSPWGQHAWQWAWGPGMRDFALALQRANEAAPDAWRLSTVMEQTMSRQGGLWVMGLGVAFFVIERAAMRIGVPQEFAQTGTMVLRLGLCMPFAVAALSLGPGYGALGVLGAVGGVFMTSWVVTWMLRGGFGALDDDRLGWFASIGRALRRTADFGGRASRGEFWGPVMALVLFSLAAGIWAPRALPWVAGALLLPMPALAVRRLRALDDSETWYLVRWLLGWLPILTRRRR